jgi:hypothetical protein
MAAEVSAPTMTMNPDVSTTQTSHEPNPDELAHATTDHGRIHPDDIAGEPHGSGDHGEMDGHDDHAHAEEALGPVDVQAWGALLIGIAAGLAVVLCLVLSTALA